MIKAGALLLAGSFFFGIFSGGKVKPDVTVDGIEVGGMPYSAAIEMIRAHHVRESLRINAPKGSFCAELAYSDNAEEVVRRARRGGTYFVNWRRDWATLEGDLLALCNENARSGENARLVFSGHGFTYIAERDAVVCDYFGLVADAVAALRAGGEEVTLRTRTEKPSVTEEMLRARTRELASFSTRYNASNTSRSHNIALAAELISGTVIAPGEEFSFNECVGARTKARGFEEAPVIFDGEFVQGVGGGVCQASTTLFGAALRAGLDVVESHPHSLSVGYVPPSQDAMVSSASDLKLKNPYPYPVYLAGRAEGGAVTFTVYGMPDGKRYRVESRVLCTLDPPEEKIVEGEEDKILRAEKQGISSESFRLVYENGALVGREPLRRDTYACVQGVREVKKALF